MAEKAFAFWQQIDQEAQKASFSSKNPKKTQPGKAFRAPSGNAGTFPLRRDAERKSTNVDPSELFRPLSRQRPHSISSLPRNLTVHSPSFTPAAAIMESKERGSDQEKEEADGKKDGEVTSSGATPSIKSAPPTMDGKSRWSMSKSDKTRHQSLGGFVSYLDGPISPPVQGQNILRSSPVVTRPTKARYSSIRCQSSTREFFTARSNLKDPWRIEMDDFWQMVESVCKETSNRQIYLKSPAISRNKPQPRGALLPSQRSPSLRLQNVPSRVTLAVEIGLVVKEPDSAVVLQCKAAGTVCEAIEEILAMSQHNQPRPLPCSSNFLLKVCGKDEYMDGDRCLMDYEYIHHCIKLAIPAHVVLVERGLVKQLVSHIGPLKIEIPQFPSTLSLQEITILYDSYITKDEDFRFQMFTPPLNYVRQYQLLTACVKLFCERAGFIEPLCVSEAVFNLKRACRTAMGRDSFTANVAIDLELLDDGWSSINTTQLKQQQLSAVQDVTHALDVLMTAVNTTVETYCQTLHTDYEPMWYSLPKASNPPIDIEQKLRVKLCGLHRVLVQELYHYDTFQVEMCLYYGGKGLCRKVLSPKAKLTKGFFPTVTWDKWMNTYVALYEIPHEARLCFTLYGLTPSSTGNYNPIKEPIAWVALRLFTCEGHLVSGLQLLGMWLSDSMDPTGPLHNDIMNRKSMALEVLVENYNYVFVDPSAKQSRSVSVRPARPAPPQAIAKNMKDLAAKDRFDRLNENDVKLVWANRHSSPQLLSSYARGLPILLQSVPNWHNEHIATVHTIIDQWLNVDPLFGLELLDGQFPDGRVRSKAAEMLSQLSEDDFIDLLPQLVQSLKHECYFSSSLTKLMLERVTLSPRVAHFLYWNLVPLTSDPYFGRKYDLLLSALLTVCGEEMAMELSQQSELVNSLSDVAAAVKIAKDQQRQTTLVHELQCVSANLSPVFRLPLNPALQCCDIEIENCSFFNSKTVPLKLSFKNADPFGSNIDVMFKVGDDLRQDMLALQLIKLMDKIWLRAGLDLRLITYRVLSTGEDQGLIELVKDSATLRQIQTEHGLAGSFKDKPLSEWLIRHNSSDSAWKQATENFIHSCAGYCVATYVLGICDRHNDNIMMCKSGHMFHIDFGRILGNAQMFGAIKRDRVPFVLTPDMAYVINAGDKPSVRFQKFTDLCCAAFNELRKHSHLFLSLLSLLLSSNIPELSSVEDILYVRDNLLPQATDDEATYHFTKNIEASLGTIATQINFFIHNLAQFKFSSSPVTQGLLSFSPSSYSIATDGKIQDAVVVAYHMRHYPEKFIVYQIQVIRCDSLRQDTIIFRRYSEFDELHSKLTECFPNEGDLPQLPAKKYLPGRSYARETSEKRRELLNQYLESLLKMDTSISESDIVYTFLHCLLRDEHDLKIMREEEQAAAEAVTGKVKLDLKYNEELKRLMIMVQHARELVPREGAESIDPYVKLYLLPDPNKTTKKKTKVARKTLNPTYNEMLYYDLTPFELRSRCLQLTVWDASSLLSKECLGCVLIELQPLYRDLTKGLVSWFDLQPASLINR